MLAQHSSLSGLALSQLLPCEPIALFHYCVQTFITKQQTKVIYFFGIHKGFKVGTNRRNEGLNLKIGMNLRPYLFFARCFISVIFNVAGLGVKGLMFYVGDCWQMSNTVLNVLKRP